MEEAPHLGHEGHAATVIEAPGVVVLFGQGGGGGVVDETPAHFLDGVGAAAGQADIHGAAVGVGTADGAPDQAGLHGGEFGFDEEEFEGGGTGLKRGEGAAGKGLLHLAGDGDGFGHFEHGYCLPEGLW